MTSSDVLQHSVTKADINPSPYYSNLSLNVLAWPNRMAPYLLPDLGPESYWTQGRDFILARTPLHEGIWASAVSIAITKMASLAWEVESEVELRRNRAQDLFHTTNLGKGWVHYLAQHLRDYLTTDNGAFTEVVRATAGVGSKIIGLVHLDSRRITRTGNPEIPYLYRDRLGALHEMKAHQVISLVDMPDPGEMYNGVGMCAASRAYQWIQYLEVIKRYDYEKVSGKNPKTIELVSGMTTEQLQSGIRTAEMQQAVEAAKKGRVQAIAYMGSIIIPSIESDGSKVGGKTIQLAGLPENFNFKEVLSIVRLEYANSIGLDPQDLEPLGGQALGVGAQSQVLDNKAKGKGLASWMQDTTHVFNNFVLDTATTFAFSERDYRDEMTRANIFNTRSTAVGNLVEKGIIEGEQGKQVMVDFKDLPEEFLPEDQTPTTSLTDTEKPQVTPEAEQAAAEVQALLNQPQPDLLAPFRKKQVLDPDKPWQEVLQLSNLLAAGGWSLEEALKELQTMVKAGGKTDGV